jgi:hypothetical protein
MEKMLFALSLGLAGLFLAPAPGHPQPGLAVQPLPDQFRPDQQK